MEQACNAKMYGIQPQVLLVEEQKVDNLNSEEPADVQCGCKRNIFFPHQGDEKFY